MKNADGFIRANSEPLPIRPEVIAVIKRHVKSGLFDEQDVLDQKIRIDDKVKIVSKQLDLFDGFEGSVTGFTGDKKKVKIDTTLFGRSQKIEVPLEFLEKLFDV